ncbi:B12-binding domain-containing radical SAM protein [bacterium]|nr:B12-binding domain-containing radical SAM protein [bacterium]
MRIAFLSFYNQYAFGARCLAAFVARAGHEPLIINFKRFNSRPISRDDPRERNEIEAGGHMPVFEVHPFNDFVCPYPTPVTDGEVELLLKRLEAFGADVVGFSITSSHMPAILQVTKAIRRRFPKMLQVWGGIHPTMDPEGCLKYADAACVGEGEEALLEYLNDPRRTDIANLHFKNKDGAYIANPHRPLMQAMDELPLPLYGDGEILIDDGREWRLEELPIDVQNDQVVISSQRGCPFSCTYCLHGVVRDMYRGQKYLRRKSVDRFLDEIETLLKRFPIETLNFWDDIFMIHPDWIEEFCDKYPKRIGRPFGGYGHPRATTRPMLEQLKGAGCAYIALGLQSGSPYISKEIYNRSVTNERYIEFGHELTETGMDTIVYDLLSRCPYEREEDLRATVHILARLPKAAKISLKHVVFFPFTRINTIDRPRVNVAPEIYHFYEMLYLLAEQPGFDPALLDKLVDDQHLRAHPEIVEAWVRQLAKAAEEKEALRGRIGQLERNFPWGIKRATQHLADQVAARLRR